MAKNAIRRLLTLLIAIYLWKICAEHEKSITDCINPCCCEHRGWIYPQWRGKPASSKLSACKVVNENDHLSEPEEFKVAEAEWGGDSRMIYWILLTLSSWTQHVGRWMGLVSTHSRVNSLCAIIVQWTEDSICNWGLYDVNAWKYSLAHFIASVSTQRHNRAELVWIMLDLSPAAIFDLHNKRAHTHSISY